MTTTAPIAADDAPASRVSVRALCALVAKSGDLDLRFTPGPSGAEGISGHQAVAASRSADYLSEVAIEGVVNGLNLRGRIDGLVPEPLRLEEIKTLRGGPEHVRDNQRTLHWAQLKTYGALYCRAHELDAIELALVYYDIDSKSEYSEPEAWTATALDAFLEDGVARYQAWAAQQQQHRIRRNRALRAMAFPHADVSVGQRTLMEAVTDTVENGNDLLVEAPTGTGKTIATLYPALKALGEDRIDKIFYLTAKTSGRREAVRAIASLQADGGALPLRVLELTAKSKACVHPDKACHGDACPLAKRFFDRLPQARDNAQHTAHLSPDAMQTIAAEHRVCPYYLSQEMVRWADVIVGDINYYYDQSALLHGLTAENDWRVAVLTDEAHNLIDRGRAMYSATVNQTSLRVAARQAPAPLRQPLADVERVWQTLLAPMDSNFEALGEPPKLFQGAATTACASIGAWFAEDPTRHDPALLECYFELLRFLRLADKFGDHSFCDLECTAVTTGLFEDTLGQLSIHNVVPAPHLAPRIKTAHCVVAFSATLAPVDFYQRMLGFDDDTQVCHAPSAFAAPQLDVRLVTNIPTIYRQRARSISPIVELVATQYRRRPGNYIAFFSSFAYLDQVASRFEQRCPDIPSMRQKSGMPEMQRNRVLARLRRERGLVVFAVLGGVFSESVDLVGERLIGAFIATIGLPPANRYNRRVAQRIDTLMGNGTGALYTYTYPGMRKVVQAAGRVIRSQGDTGTVMLIDQRYAGREVQKLLPAWWALRMDS